MSATPCDVEVLIIQTLVLGGLVRTNLVGAWKREGIRRFFFCCAQKRPHVLVCESSPCVQDCEDKNPWKRPMSKQSPDQSPPLGLDSRKSGARLRADWLQAKWSVPAFPPQQKVNAR